MQACSQCAGHIQITAELIASWCQLQLVLALAPLCTVAIPDDQWHPRDNITHS